MAQQNAKPPSQDSRSKHRPDSLDLPSETAQAARQPDTTSNLSPAERYILGQAQASGHDNFLNDTASVASSTTSGSHTEVMDAWREKEINDRHKSHPFQYKYGTPPSPSTRSTNTRTDRHSGHSLFSLIQKAKK